MADVFLKCDIEGDSVATNHEGEIDCESWHWSAHQPANMHNAKGGAASGSQVGDVSITKKMDKASANLMKFCCKGNHLPEVIMTCTKSSGDQDIEWLVLTMKNVIISNVSFSGASDQNEGGEEITLNFEEYKLEYFEQTETGSKGAGIAAAYNMAKKIEV